MHERFLAEDLDRQLRAWAKLKAAGPGDIQVSTVGSHPRSQAQLGDVSWGDKLCGSWRAKQEKAGGSSWLVATMTLGELRVSSGMAYLRPPLARVVSLTTSIQIILSSE